MRPARTPRPSDPTLPVFVTVFAMLLTDVAFATLAVGYLRTSTAGPVSLGFFALLALRFSQLGKHNEYVVRDWDTGVRAVVSNFVLASILAGFAYGVL